MKKLQLKVRDLKNPSILTHQEIKNIMGGSGVFTGSAYTCGFYRENSPNAEWTCYAASWQDCYDATFDMCTDRPIEECEMAYCNH